MAVTVPDDLGQDDVFAKYGLGTSSPGVQPSVPADDVFSKYGLQAPEPEPQPMASNPVRRIVGDTGISALKGMISVPEAVVGIADIPTFGLAGKAAEAIGFKPKQAKEYLDEFLTPEQQAANQAVQETKGFFPTIGAHLQNPSTIVQGITESVPQMLGGAAIARKAVMPVLGKIAPSLSEGVAGTIGGAVGEGVVGAGSAAETYRQESPTGDLGIKGSLSALASGAGTAAFGAAGGFLAKKLGIADIDTALATGKLGQEAAATAKEQAALTAKSWYRKLAEGAISEGVFEEMPQSAQEQMWQNFATGKPLMERVAESAASGLVLGAAMGGPVAAVSKPAGPISRAADIAQGTGAAPAPLLGPETPAGPAAPVPEDQPHIFGFTEKGAETRARLLGMQGNPQTIIPHPIHEGRFSVIPDKVSTATDTAGRIEGLLEQAETIINAMPAGRPATAAVATKLNEIQEELAKLRETKIKEEEDAQRVEVARAAKDKANAPIPYAPVETQKLLPAPEEGGFTAEEGEGAAVEPKYTGEKVDGKVHPQVGPFKLILENQAGSVRRSKPGALQQWARKMTAHYGYFRGVAARAPDKGRVDTFVKPGTTEDHAGPAFVIDQNKPEGGFDEPKVMLGYGSREEAIAGYLENYPHTQRKNIHGVTELSAIELRDRLDDPNAFMQPQPEATPIGEVGDLETAVGEPSAGEKPAEPGKPAEPEKPSEGSLSDEDLNKIFDEAAADEAAEKLAEPPAEPAKPAEPEKPVGGSRGEPAGEPEKLDNETVAGIKGGLSSVDADTRESWAFILERKLQKKGSLTWQDVPQEMNAAMDTTAFGALKRGLEQNPRAAIEAVRVQAPAEPEKPAVEEMSYARKVGRVAAIAGRARKAPDYPSPQAKADWLQGYDEIKAGFAEKAKAEEEKKKAEEEKAAAEEFTTPEDEDEEWGTEVGHIYAEDDTRLTVRMRQVRDVGGRANVVRQEISLTDDNSGREMAKWEVRTATTDSLEELGVKIETSIFHYTLTENSDEMFKGIDSTDGEAMWARYGPEILEQIRESGLVPSRPEKPVQPEPPALAPPAEPDKATAEQKEAQGYQGEGPKEVKVFASGMSRIGDFPPALEEGVHFGVDIGQLSKNGIAALAEGLKESGSHVFVDSGAYSLFRANLRRGKVPPFTGAEFGAEGLEGLDFEDILKRYDELMQKVAEADVDDRGRPNQLYFVMPDVVGDQEASLQALRDHRDAIADGNVFPENAIYPLQAGEKTLLQMYDEIVSIMGKTTMGGKQVHIVGIPSNALAAPPAQVAELIKARGKEIDGVHFLGAGSRQRLTPLVQPLLDAGYDGEISGDSNVLRSGISGEGSRAQAMRKVLADREPERLKRLQLTREYERDIFAGGLTSEPIMQLAQLSEEQFLAQAPEILGRHVKALLNLAEDPDARFVLNGFLDGDKARLDPKLLKAMYQQAQARAKELEKEKHRDPAVYQAAFEKAAIDANVGDSTEMRAAFMTGFSHALKGKTRSSLTGNLMGVVNAGYDAAREWMKTPEGSYFYDGTRQKKEQSTGEELRRHWELVKKGLTDLTSDDMKKSWDSIKRSTVRADAFPLTLDDDATPGAKAWMAEFRGNLATFSEYFSARAVNDSDGRSAEEIFRGITRSTGGEFRELEREDDQQRLEKTVVMAQDYITVMSDLANRFTGLKNLAEIEPVLKGLFGSDVDNYREAPYVKLNGPLFRAPLSRSNWHQYYLPWPPHPNRAKDWGRGREWRKLLADENNAAKFATTTRAKLVRPRLDKIERGGMAYDRKGRDITTEEFKRTFNFADVTIGRYVTSEQAQDHLNYAYDALLDLSEILGATPEKLSFGGKLHFAIGALGHGKAAAHFNPAHPLTSGGNVPVINVTNTQGDGSVLHEYFHAIDFLTRDAATRNAIKEIKEALQRTQKSPDEILVIARGFLVNGRKFTQMGRSATALDHAKYALQTWFAHQSHATDRTSFYHQAEILDGGKAEAYWSNEYEPWARASEAWGFDLLKDKSARSDYLVSPDWIADGYLKQPMYRGRPYPEGEERKAFNAIFQEFIDQLEWTDNGPRLKDASPWRDGKTPMAARNEAFHTARKDALARLPELQTMFEAEKREEERTRREEAQKKKDEQFFGKPNEEPPATLDPAPSPNDTGPLTDGELDVLFDDAAAELREGVQEKPEDPGPGAPALGGTVPTVAETPQPTPPAGAKETPEERTAAQAIKAFAAEGITGIDEALKGLVKLFGGGRIQSFPGGFDKDAYEQAKPHFEKALAATIRAGKALKDFFRILVQLFGEGVKPYALQFAKEKKLGANLTGDPAPEPEKPAAKHPEAPEADPARPIADWVQNLLEGGVAFDWRDLFKKADEAYGGTQAEGKYAVKDAYDAMELGVNQFLLTQPSFLKEGPRSAIAALDRLLNLLPTQTKRTLEQDEFQQFSTPPTHAFLANWVANIQKGESYLEPSAGIGGLGVFGKNAGARVTVNELSARRLALLHALPFDRFTAENAEHLNSILPADIKPTVIVMNPPFSSTAGRIPGERETMNGAKHVEEALARLEPGGRLVAIVGEGMGPDKPAFRMWWGKIKSQYTVRANIGIDGKAYVKYGTSFGNQILVIDKIGAHSGADTTTGQVATPADAVPLLEAVRVSRTLPAASTEGTAPSGPQTGIPGRPGTLPPGQGAGPAGLPGGGTAPGVGTGGATGPGTQPPGGGAGVPGGPAQPPGRGPGGGRGGRATGQPGSRPGQQPTGADPREEPLGSRPEDLRSGAESPLVVGAAAEAEAAGGEINNSTFENYTPKKVRIEGAHSHITPLVESAALATVLPPDPTYRPHLPPSVITEGKLSLAQLETVVYAGQAHSQMLPDGTTRRGHFIGDGTGVGKGREISGIILDNWNQGRKRAIWISEKPRLFADAKRDFGNTGGDPKLIRTHYDYKDKKIDFKEGILFSTYTLMRGESAAHKAAAAAGTPPHGANALRFERNQQLLEWLGKDFDGVIAFDEAHNMANLLEQQSGRGGKDPSLQALAAVELQRTFPKARIEYVSATGATEISNLAYAERLGLWGVGTPFATVQDFTVQLGRSVTIMELVAQNMKQLGLYNARSLSYNGGTPETTVVYEKLEHELTDYQTEVYDELAGGWQIVLQNINAALQQTGITGANGAAQGARGATIRGNLMAQFFGNMLRFFNQTITAMQMPSVFDQVDKDLAENKSVVFQVVATQGADLERALGGRKAKKLKPGEEAEEIEDLDLSPREGLLAYLEKAFPIHLYEMRPNPSDPTGRPVLTLVTDSKGDPVVSQAALALKNKMIHMVRHELRIPEGPLQQLMAKFGPDGLAEVTGRKQRTVPGHKGGQVIEKRSEKDVAADIKAFEDGKKRALVFNNAGGTGVSFHSDRTHKNQQQRSHYIIQTDWSANKVVQATGRTHRTNQASAPIYHLVTTDVPAQKRFITSVARRLEQLGALTAGQRDTAGGGSLFTAADNLESEYATRAMRAFFTNLINSNIQAGGYANLVARDVVTGMGLPNLIDSNGGLNESAMPTIPKFLNRMLALKIAMQKEVFKLFSDELDMQIEVAKRDGKFDDGMRTINHIGAEAVAENVVYQDDKTNASTRHFEIAVKQKNRFYNFQDVAAVLRASSNSTWFKNKQSGRVQGVWKTATTRTGKDGVIRPVYGVYRTSGATYETADTFDKKNLETLKQDEAQVLWEKENAVRPKEVVHNTHMVVGSMLPIWNRFNNDHVDVARIKLDDGRRLLGRVIPEKDLESTLGRLNIKSREAQMTGADIIKEALAGKTVRMSNSWQIKRSVVSGQTRVEITGFGFPSRAVQTRMATAGAFFEKIAHDERLFVPTSGGAVLDKLMEEFAMNPVEVKAPGGAQLSVASAARGGQSPRALKTELTKALGRTPGKVRFVETWQEMPPEVAAHIIATGNYNVQGIHDSATDTVYLVSSRIRPGLGLSVYLHEVGVHQGMREFLGEQAFNRLSGQVLEWATSGANTEEARIAARALARVPTGLSEADYAEELVAYFVEEAVRAGHGTESKSRIGEWLRQLVAAIGAALKKLTSVAATSDLTTDEIVALAHGAAQRVQGLRYPAVESALQGPSFSTPVHPLQFGDATESDLYQTRTAAEVGFVSDAQAMAKAKQNGIARRIMEGKGATPPKSGERVGVRLALGVQQSTGAVVQTLHKGTSAGDYMQGKGWASRPVLGYANSVTLKNAYFAVDQEAREDIATGTKKTPMASVDGEYVRQNEPNFDGIVVGFNPKREHLFVDSSGYAVKSAEEVTIYGHKAYLRGKVEYFGKVTTPARAGDAPSAVVPTTMFSQPVELDVTHPLQFGDATDSPLYKKRSAAEVGLVDDSAKIAAVLAKDKIGIRVMNRAWRPEPDQVIGARINLNLLRYGILLQSIHAGDVKERYKQGVGLYSKPPMSYMKTVTLRDAYFNVSQSGREAIVSTDRGKHHMASVDGKFVREEDPNFDGIEVSFNPHRVHLFVDRNGYAIRSAEEVTVYGHRAYARGRIEYYGKVTTPARAGITPSNVVPTTKFSLSADDDPTRAAEGVRERVLSAVRGMTGGNLAQDEGVLNAWNKSVGTPELVARKNPAFAKVFWEGQAYLGDINRFIADAEKLLPSWFRGHDILSRWFDRVRGKEIAHAEKATKALLDGTIADKVYTPDELAARGLSPAEIGMYEEARNAVDAILERTGAALIAREAAEWAPLTDRLIRVYRQNGLQGLEEFANYSTKIGNARIDYYKEQVAGANPAWADIMRTRLDVEEKKLQEWQIVVKTVANINKLQREGYFPLSRYGKHYVSVTDPRGEAVEFRMYETEALARVGAVQMGKKYPSYEVKRGTLSQHTNELFQGLTPESVELFAELLGHDQDAAMQAWLKEAIANRSALKRMIHRKGTEGYSRDAVRVLADFISVNARYASRLAHSANLNEYAHDIRGGELRDYAIKLVQYLRGDDGREEYHTIRGFLFFQYIGGNISSALLNLTQVPMVTLPWLTQHTSTANATAALARAYKLSMSDPENIPGELGDALRQAERDGLTDPQNVYNTMAIGAGSKLARIGAFSGFLDAWAHLFGRAEKINRRVTFIAAYEVAKANGKSAEEAYALAKDGVDTTQFIYNKGNRPAWARGIGALPFTFKQFTIGMLENIFSRMPHRQKAILLALLFLGAGGEGLPFAEDLEDILDTIGQKLGFATNSKRALKEGLEAALQEFLGLPRDTAIYAAEMVRRGVFANTPLASLGARIGMGNIIPGTSAFLTGRDMGKEFSEALGPVASLTQNVGSAMELVTRGEYGRAAEKVLPSAAANVMKGARQLQQGKDETAFGMPVTDVPPEQALLQTIGISGQKVAHARERQEIVRQNKQYLKVVEDRIADKWAKAIVEKDATAVADARADLAAHNERNPDQKIRITPLQIQMRVRNLKLDPEKALIRSLPAEQRRGAREFLSQP